MDQSCVNYLDGGHDFKVDTLVGGQGLDTFVEHQVWFTPHNESLWDFNAAEDRKERHWHPW